MPSRPEHPTYPNPTVVEALCHIEFEPSPQSAWQITRPTAFLQALSEEYPNVELGPQISVTMGIGPGGVAPRLTPSAQQLRLSSQDRTRYISVGDKHFAFGHVVPYPGWAKFRDFLVSGWRCLTPLAGPQVIPRITLRYVNVIPRTASHPHLSDWLKPTETIPATLVKSEGEPFMFRVESWVESNSLLIVTIGQIRPPGTLSPIVFDIDRTSRISTAPDSEALLEHIDQLHEDVWHEFASARTSQLEAHLLTEKK